jgi:hypothetical protein
MFKSYPTLALDTLGSTGVADGRLMRFKITASNSGSVGVSQFNMTVSTTSATVTNLQLFGFTDSAYSQPVSVRALAVRSAALPLLSAVAQ